MNNLTTHGGSFLGGGVLFAAIVGILTVQFHMDATLATNWLIAISGLIGTPLLAYLAFKARTDPALAAVMDAIAAAAQQNQAPPTVTATATTATPTGTPTATIAATVTQPSPPPPPAPATPPLVTPAGQPITPPQPQGLPA